MGPIQRTIKRGGDIVAVLLAAPVALPLGLLVAAAVRREDGPPALFRQQRAGLDGHPFTLYKFRTMRTDVDAYGPSPKGEQDERLTRVGRWLRKTSLDELPQLWNVLKGQMSLVGPRPLYLEQAAEWTPRQRRRLEVLPGLTGLAQVRGRASLTIEEKLELDVQYVQRQRLAFDARILWATLVQLVRPGDIYEVRYSAGRDTWREERSQQPITRDDASR